MCVATAVFLFYIFETGCLMMAVLVQLKYAAFRITVTKCCVWMVSLIFICIRISLYFCAQETHCHAIFSCQTSIYQLLLTFGSRNFTFKF